MREVLFFDNGIELYVELDDIQQEGFITGLVINGGWDMEYDIHRHKIRVIGSRPWHMVLTDRVVVEESVWKRADKFTTSLTDPHDYYMDVIDWAKDRLKDRLSQELPFAHAPIV